METHVSFSANIVVADNESQGKTNATKTRKTRTALSSALRTMKMDWVSLARRLVPRVPD